MIRAFPLLIASVAFAACALDIIAPRSDLDSLPPGLDVQFTVEPVEVRQHERFTAQLSVTNTTADTIRVVTSHGCLVIPNVIRNGQRIPFKGSWWGCTAAITTHSFAPGETRMNTWEMAAELYAEHPGDIEGAPAPKGNYLVQAEFDTYSENGPSRKPSVERPLRVK
jgi:hypothetical protein